MNIGGDEDGPKPPPDDQATVFVPSSSGLPQSTNEPGGNLEEEASDEGEAVEGDNRSAPAPGADEPTSHPPGPGSDRREGAYASIKVGDCLNHIYEVKRFIARGGMGEVFEGVNITSDERVAIKVMLPSLAADPNVIAMFRREAQAMTRLQHEALVQYRVLAQEPRSGVLYIVTEYIDGVPLCDVLDTLRPSPDQVKRLLRRLASGLRAAHQLGVLHRDISPDNVLLEAGEIDRATIVDFGIAKDLSPGSSTIIGEGFAGKLGYVAPEQLGDYDRELGPWTDVYSLGLVMTAMALGRDLKMGGTLVDAVDRRRAGPDLSEVPIELRPVLAAMLRPNPADRLRSMDEVLAMLDPPPAGATPPAAPAGKDDRRNSRLPILVGIAGGLLLVVLLGLWLATLPGDRNAGSSTGTAAPGPEAGPTRIPIDPVQLARSTIDNLIPSISCSWLDVVSVGGTAKELNVVVGGVAGSPSAAQGEVVEALRNAGLPNSNTDFSSIAPIEPGGCAAINAYRQFRNTEAPRLLTEHRTWHMDTKADNGDYAGQLVARPVIRFSTGDPNTDLMLIGIAPSGLIDTIIKNRASLEQGAASSLAAYRAGTTSETNPTKVGPDRYEIKLDINHEGWSGLVLLTGKGPFSADLVTPPLGARNSAWLNRFATVATQQGWKADMLWFKVDDQRTED